MPRPQSLPIIELEKIMADCLSTPLILRELFHNFSSTQLLQLSLVNKQWNHEARSLIRIRGNLTARINKKDSCEGLRAFASDLKRMTDMKKVIPFSGITITLRGSEWGHVGRCEGMPTGELEQVYEDMLDQMTFKHLAVSFSTYWDQCKNCPAFLLVRRLFQKYGCTLEELSLQLQNKQEFIQAVLQGCSFPCLQTFRLQKWNPSSRPNGVNPDDTILIKALVSIAPNLQVLYTEERVNLEANLLEGSSAMHFTDCQYSPCLDEIPDSVAGELRMTRMKLDSIGPQFSIDKFNRITYTLLHNSCLTLSSMEITPIFLVPLMSYGWSLRNVRKLSLMFTVEGLEFRQPLLWRLLKSFDFKRIFPNLSTVHVSWIYISDFMDLFFLFHDMIERANATFVEPMLDRAKNIKNILILGWDHRIRDPFPQFLAKMVPDVQKLSIRSLDIPFTSIWDSWLDLKELEVIIDCFHPNRDKLDSVFCGIFPAEVALLQQHDEEYLRRVIIVPVKPSITCLKGLRTLKMAFDNFCLHEIATTDDPTRVLSKVTGQIAFKRLPYLTVNLRTNDQRTKEALSHLKPYASVVLGKILATELNFLYLEN